MGLVQKFRAWGSFIAGPLQRAFHRLAAHPDAPVEKEHSEEDSGKGPESTVQSPGLLPSPPATPSF